MNVSAIPKGRKLYPPATAEAIAGVSRFLPAELPEDYATLLSQADGVYADHFTLFSCEELPERNATFEIGKYLPGFVIIGGDGGGSALIMRGGRGRPPVYLVGHGAMFPEFMFLLAESLEEWITAGCPVDPDAEPSAAPDGDKRS